MRSEKVAIALLAVTILAVLPIIHAQPLLCGANDGDNDADDAPCSTSAIAVGVQGAGTVYWSSSYGGSTLASGSTDVTTSIVVPQGATVTFTAVPKSGNNFDNWVIDSASQTSINPYIMAIGGYTTVTAEFDLNLAANPPLQNPQFDTFNVGVGGLGRVYWSSSSGDSGWVDDSSSFAIPQGATVTFTAVPLNGHHFSNWVIDGADQGSNNPFIMYGTGASSVATVQADFDQTFFANPPLQNPPIQYSAINVGVQGSGKLYWSASYGGAAYTSGSTESVASIQLPQGTIVSFTAVPMNGDHFDNWIVNSAALTSTNPYIVSSIGVGSPSTVFAVFDQDFAPNPPLQIPSIQYDTIRVDAQGSGRLHWSYTYGSMYNFGSTDTSTSIAVPHGATVTFTAVPMNGDHFSNWMIDSANQGSVNPYVVHSTADDCCRPATVAAVFTQA